MLQQCELDEGRPYRLFRKSNNTSLQSATKKNATCHTHWLLLHISSIAECPLLGKGLSLLCMIHNSNRLYTGADILQLPVAYSTVCICKNSVTPRYNDICTITRQYNILPNSVQSHAHHHFPHKHCPIAAQNCNSRLQQKIEVPARHTSNFPTLVLSKSACNHSISHNDNLSTPTPSCTPASPMDCQLRPLQSTATLKLEIPHKSSKTQHCLLRLQSALAVSCLEALAELGQRAKGSLAGA